MEIYRQTLNRVYFEAPESTSVVNATIALNDGTPVVMSTVTGNGGGTTLRSIEIPYINDEGTLTVEWSWAGTELTSTGISTTPTATQRDTYEVVTPILSKVEIKNIHPDATDAEIIAVERATRHIINAYTGQRFGRFVGVKRVRGNGTQVLNLPERLVSLSKVNGSAITNLYLLDESGYTLRHYPWGVPPLKADYHGLHYTTNGVIHNPNNVRLGDWSQGAVYEIDGTWGWEEVPSQVSEAARLLVNDYACADTNYRDKYLTSMTAADWRIQFHPGAFRNTGNVRADQLLRDFIISRGWAVV